MKPLCPFWVFGITPIRWQIGFPSILRFICIGIELLKTQEEDAVVGLFLKRRFVKHCYAVLHNTADIRAPAVYTVVTMVMVISTF